MLQITTLGNVTAKLPNWDILTKTNIHTLAIKKLKLNSYGFKDFLKKKYKVKKKLIRIFSFKCI
ncbi:hypothetical protein DAHU10_013130 [Hanseniaspora uvarum]|nr:hypothetical protein DAHU10_013130 [Hanseniaspora uvarum]